jgi:ABC-type multidrug transport system fused ATPase/permease subunit
VDIAVMLLQGEGSISQLKLFSLFMALVVLVRIAFNALRTYVQNTSEVMMKNSLRIRLFDMYLHLDHSDAGRHHTGDIVNRMQEDVRTVASSVMTAVPALIGASVQLVAAAVFFMWLDMRIALAVMVIIPLGIVAGRFVSKRIRTLTKDIRESDAKIQSHVQENIQHHDLLQAMEYLEPSVAGLGALQGDMYGRELKRTRFTIISRICLALSFQAGQVVAFICGAFGIAAGTVTYGMMTAFLQLVGQIQRPLMELSQTIPGMIHALASVDRIIEIEDLPSEKADESVMLEGAVGVRLENVCFAYPDSVSDVLSDFSYDFAPGSRTAIVGPTGVGKSTLIRLLLSLLHQRSGEISLYSADGVVNVPVSAATRRNLVYVPQGNSLFSGTIRDNLLVGNPDATEQQMLEALHTAAADFVQELPYGIDTQCFEKGAGLSEGQAQRIAIARALLRPGRILLLDEFSSALDAQTETLLLERLTATRSDRTMIFITHRDRVIDFCDATLSISKEG